MKLLLSFLVFFFFALAQEIRARPYPGGSSSSSSWFSGIFTSSSSGYDQVTLPTPLNTKSLDSTDISAERADLLTQGTIFAEQVLDLVGIVPGLQSVSYYGKESVKMAKDLGKSTMEAVNTFHENFFENVAGLGSQIPIIANGSKTIKSGIEAVLTIIEQAIEGIRHLSSVGENILNSLHLTREQLVSVNGIVNYL